MYTISVSSLTGNTLTFEFVNKNITISDFKKVVSAGHSGFILTSAQRLIYKGKQLEDHQILEYYLAIHPIGEPILIHLVLRMSGGTSPMPPIESSFPHQENMRTICVSGRHWVDRPIPEVPKVPKLNWYPQGLHNKPASKELYQELLKDIRDTPRSVEEVGHDLLIKDGYIIKEDGWYYKAPVKVDKSEKQILIDSLIQQLSDLLYDDVECYVKKSVALTRKQVVCVDYDREKI